MTLLKRALFGGFRAAVVGGIRLVRKKKKKKKKRVALGTTSRSFISVTLRLMYVVVMDKSQLWTFLKMQKLS